MGERAHGPPALPVKKPREEWLEKHTGNALSADKYHRAFRWGGAEKGFDIRKCRDIMVLSVQEDTESTKKPPAHRAALGLYGPACYAASPRPIGVIEKSCKT